MKTFILKQLFLVFLINCFFISSKGQTVSSIKCPIVIGPRGAQILISFNSAKKICQSRIKYVEVEKMKGSPAYAADLYKNGYESTKNDSMILVSEASRRYFTAPGGGMSFLMFRGQGVGAYWLGYEKYNGKYYTMKKDSSLQLIGLSEKAYRTTPDGRSILMTKGTGKSDYFAGSSNGKIYKAKGVKEAEQIGVFSFFWLPPSKNSKLRRAIVMTKGLKETDKWCGEQDGVIYIQK